MFFNKNHSDTLGYAFTILVIVLFAAGMFIGMLSVEQSLNLVESNYTVHFGTKSFLSAIWYVFKFPLLVAFLGLSFLGFIIIPLLSFCRGFLVSYSVSLLVVCAESFSFSHLFFSTILMYLFTVPVFLVLSVLGSRKSYSYFSNVVLHNTVALSAEKNNLFVFLFSFLILFLAAIYLWYVMPYIHF